MYLLPDLSVAILLKQLDSLCCLALSVVHLQDVCSIMCDVIGSVSKLL